MNDQWHQPALHPVYLRLLGALLSRRGADVPALLAAVHLQQPAIEGDALLPFAPVHQLLAKVLEDNACPWLGLEFGAAAHLHAHGSVSNATIASGTLDTALQTLTRYAALRTRAVRFEISRDPERTHLHILPAFDLGVAAGFFADALMVMIERMLQTLSGTRLEGARYTLPMPRPPWADRYAEFLAGRVGFGGEPLVSLHFDRAILERPCLTADRQAYARAMIECEGDLARGSADPPLVARIQTLLRGCSERFPSAEEAARQMHMSPRTLFRQLQAGGSSFRELVDQQRSERACWLLRNSRLSIELIAERLGYADTSNFSRTFRRWLGVTPRGYRSRSASVPAQPQNEP